MKKKKREEEDMERKSRFEEECEGLRWLYDNI